MYTTDCLVITVCNFVPVNVVATGIFYIKSRNVMATSIYVEFYSKKILPKKSIKILNVLSAQIPY